MFKKYDFLTDDIIKIRLISFGFEISDYDIFERKMSPENIFIFEFSYKEKNRLPSSNSIMLPEEVVNEIFLKEIRKEKLLCLKK
jgi:hypothetical protein